MRDNKGPEKTSLRLRVATGDFVDFSHAHTHSKKQQLQKQAPQKNVEQEDASRQRQSLMRDFDKGLGRHGEEEDFNAIGQNMLLSSGGDIPGSSSAFNGAGVLLGNVTDLLAADGSGSEDDERPAGGGGRGAGKGKGRGKRGVEDQEVVAAAGGGVREQQPGSGKKAKKEDWFDAESKVNRARTSFTAQIASAKASLNSAMAHVDKQLVIVRSLSAAEADAVRKVVDAAKFRRSFAEAVLQGSGPESLAAFVDKVTKGAEKAPCQQWMDLTPVATLEGKAEAAFEKLRGDGQTTLDDIQRVTTSLSEELRLFAGLAATTKTAGSDIASAKKTWDRLSAQKAKRDQKDDGGETPAPGTTGGAANPAKRARKTLTRPVFEYGAAAGRQIKSYHSKEALDQELAAMDPIEPWILSDPSMAATMAALPELKAAMGAFISSWRSSPNRSGAGRASQRLGSAEAEAGAKLTEPLASCIIRGDHGALSQVMAPRLFAIAAGTDTAIMEQGCLGSLRLAVAGAERMLVLISVMGLCEVLGWNPDDGSILGQVCGAALNLTQEVVKKLADQGSLHCATVGTNELLCTPAGYIACELVGPGQANGRDATARDIVGVKVGALLGRKRHAALEVQCLEHFIRMTTAQLADKPAAGPGREMVKIIQSAVDVLKTASLGVAADANSAGQPPVAQQQERGPAAVAAAAAAAPLQPLPEGEGNAASEAEETLEQGKAVVAAAALAEKEKMDQESTGAAAAVAIVAVGPADPGVEEVAGLSPVAAEPQPGTSATTTSTPAPAADVIQVAAVEAPPEQPEVPELQENPAGGVAKATIEVKESTPDAAAAATATAAPVDSSAQPEKAGAGQASTTAETAVPPMPVPVSPPSSTLPAAVPVPVPVPRPASEKLELRAAAPVPPSLAAAASKAHAAAPTGVVRAPAAPARAPAPAVAPLRPPPPPPPPPPSLTAARMTGKTEGDEKKSRSK